MKNLTIGTKFTFANQITEILEFIDEETVLCDNGEIIKIKDIDLSIKVVSEEEFYGEAILNEIKKEGNIEKRNGWRM